MVGLKVGPKEGHLEALMVVQMEGRLEGRWGQEMGRLIQMHLQEVVTVRLVLQK